MRQHLIDPLQLGARFHGLDGSAREPAAEIERHRRALAALGPADAVLLGLGRNGHAAFNEPGSPPGCGARVVELGASTIQALGAHFPHEHVRPRRGLTLGLAEIAAAKRIVLLVTGAAKAAILAQLLHAPPSSERPASLLKGHAHFFVLADEAAAGDAARAGA